MGDATGSTNRTFALHYAARGWRVFPCRRNDKQPLTKPDLAHDGQPIEGTGGFHKATTDPDLIRAWWRQWPNALIGFWPGPSDVAVLDIDMKDGKDGLATLARLDCPILPATPTVHTRSGGFHLHMQMPEKRIGITAGDKGQGIGVGLDWRGDKGYAILPSPGSGYRWGQWHYGNCQPVPVPPTLMPREVDPAEFADDSGAGLEGGDGPSIGSLIGILKCVSTAKKGERNNLLFWGACRLAEGVASGIVSRDKALELLLYAAAMTGLDERPARSTIASAFRRVAHAR